MSDSGQIKKNLQSIEKHIEYVEKETFTLLREDMIDDINLYQVVYNINQKMHAVRKILSR